MRFRLATAVTLALAVALFARLYAAPKAGSGDPILIYSATPHYDGLAWLHGGDRFPGGARLMLRNGGSSRTLLPGFFATADSNISFDGTKVLFAGKKSSVDAWQIWEVAVTGGGAKQLTACDDDCVRPLYLPDERFVYSRKTGGQFQMETASFSGGETLRLTSIPGSALATDVLRDGRILFEAAYPLGEGASPEMYTVYPDGSGVESYRCDHGKARHSGRQMGSGDIVLVSDSGLARFTSASAHEVQVTVPSGEFAGDMIESEGRDKLGSWRPSATTTFVLAEWNEATNTAKPVVTEAGSDLVQPQIVAARPTPNRFPSGLHDWNGANVLCLNTYTSKLRIASGSVDSVNLYTRSEGQPVLAGNAHVEADGSFFLHVPADKPIQLELLDKAGNVVQREKGWFWMRRGEQRVCVGCHAGPERAPENAVPQVLLKSTEPADLTGKTMSAAKGGH